MMKNLDGDSFSHECFGLYAVLPPVGNILVGFMFLSVSLAFKLYTAGAQHTMYAELTMLLFVRVYLAVLDSIKSLQISC